MSNIQDFYDDISGSYNDTIPGDERENAYNRIKKFDKMFSSRYGDEKNQIKVLDLGCGTGEYAVKLAEAGYNITGIDISNGMLEICKKAAREQGVSVDLLCSDWNTGLGSFKEAFHVILCLGNSLHHNPMEYIQELFYLCFKALKRNGLLILTCRNYDEDLGLIPPREDNYRLVELREDIDIPRLGKRNVIKYIFRNISMKDGIAKIAFYTYDNYRKDRRTFNFHILETCLDSTEKRKLTTKSCDVFYVFKDDILSMLQSVGFSQIGDKIGDIELGVSHKWWYLAGIIP